MNASIRMAEAWAKMDGMSVGLTKAELFNLIINGGGRGIAGYITTWPADRKAPTTQPSGDANGSSQ